MSCNCTVSAFCHSLIIQTIGKKKSVVSNDGVYFYKYCSHALELPNLDKFLEVADSSYAFHLPGVEALDYIDVRYYPTPQPNL